MRRKTKKPAPGFGKITWTGAKAGASGNVVLTVPTGTATVSSTGGVISVDEFPVFHNEKIHDEHRKYLTPGSLWKSDIDMYEMKNIVSDYKRLAPYSAAYSNSWFAPAQRVEPYAPKDSVLIYECSVHVKENIYNVGAATTVVCPIRHVFFVNGYHYVVLLNDGTKNFLTPLQQYEKQNEE